MLTLCVVFMFISDSFDVILAQNRNDQRCGISSVENQYPWLVGIELKTETELVKRIHCSGALISRRHVLTNAHCFYGLYRGEPRKSVHFRSNITIIAGSCVGSITDNRCRDDGSTRVPIEVVVLHPDYDATKLSSFEAASEYDIALLKLREMVPYTNFIRPICLPSSDVAGLADIDRELYIVGLLAKFPPEKHGGALNYTKRTDCGNNFFIEDEVCAVENEFFKTCLIEGSLVINKRGDHYELVGLVVRWSHCISRRVFVNLFLHLDWIRSNVTGWNTDGCGKRKIEHTELILNGEETKAGNWPWHVAIYRLKKSSIQYICGGTLISKTMVLTAAHCVTIKDEPVNPEILSVVLGKYNLIGKDIIESQEIEVHSVIAHEDYAQNLYFKNDIALLKLTTEATYNDYVQPACIWSKEANNRLPIDRDFGTVVGWGINEQEIMSPKLKQTKMPKVSDITCIRKNPLFYTKALENNKKFCAGWANGTSPCNGDSGGGFLVFVPDTAGDDAPDAFGSWHVRGIVSLTVLIRNLQRCDPYQYVIFTDVDKYTDWIQRYLVN